MNTTADTDVERTETTAQKGSRVRAKITEQVVALLGKPNDLWKIDVHLYKAGHARVNVWQKEMVRTGGKGGFMGARSELTEAIHITDSHYLRVSSSSIIDSANPPIQRKY